MIMRQRGIILRNCLRYFFRDRFEREDASPGTCVLLCGAQIVSNVEDDSKAVIL
jgi:hypothetical protein